MTVATSNIKYLEERYILLTNERDEQIRQLEELEKDAKGDTLRAEYYKQAKLTINNIIKILDDEIKKIKIGLRKYDK